MQENKLQIILQRAIEGAIAGALMAILNHLIIEIRRSRIQEPEFDEPYYRGY